MAVVAGERRIVTVLFADIVGSTGISERLGAERFTLLVDEVMHVMSAEIERFDGTVVQYIGDELYAVFGAPVAHEDDSERAGPGSARDPACARPVRGRRRRGLPGRARRSNRHQHRSGRHQA